MSCTNHLSDELRARGFRITQQRMAILSLLHDTPGHFSPTEIFEHVRPRIPGVNEATVYRTLDFLAENSIIMPFLQSDGHLAYEDAKHAHHHLVCRDCGASNQIDHASLHDLYNQLETDSGYKLDNCHLTFFGFCPDCQNKSGRR